MDSLSKGLSLLLVVVLVASSLLIIQFSTAQSTTDLYIPQFTVRIVAHPYDVPPSQSIDPYTGKVTNQNGYHVENATIEMKIKNQPSNNPHLYYGIGGKGHFEQTWVRNTDENSPKPTNSDYTILLFPIIYAPNSKVDYQVETFIGLYVFHPPTDGNPIGSGWYFTIEQESGWSDTQTLNIPDTSASASPNPTSTPAVPEFPFVVIPLIFGVFAIAVILKHRKTISQNKPNV
jgi:hypothetical protein